MMSVFLNVEKTRVLNPRPGRRNRVWVERTDEEMYQFLKANMFTHVRKIEDGTFVGIIRLMFTHAVCTDITFDSPYAYRWCFESLTEAEHFIDTIKEFDEVPKVRTSLKGHRYTDQPRIVLFCENGFPRW